jgi:hypothetical protein
MARFIYQSFFFFKKEKEIAFVAGLKNTFRIYFINDEKII